jgi:hypothetical protein
MQCCAGRRVNRPSIFAACAYGKRQGSADVKKAGVDLKVPPVRGPSVKGKEAHNDHH